MTPEGRVKAAVNKVLEPYIKRGDVYKFMPVQTGFGKKTLDYLLCVKCDIRQAGHFCSIETKAPGEVPTALQEAHIREIAAAGGTVFVIDGESDDHLAGLTTFLRLMTGKTYASSSKSKAQSRRRSLPPRRQESLS